MPISVKDADRYKLVYAVWYKEAGVWKEVPTIDYKIGGAWKRVHTKLTPFIFNKIIAVNTYGYNLREDAILAGWDKTSPLIANVTINAGIVVGGVSDSSFAFTTGIQIPAGSILTLINNGTICGMGGKGADSGKVGQLVPAPDGRRAGGSLFSNMRTELYNYGSILAAGGGGGGGGMAASQDFTIIFRGGAGGGGMGANTSLAGVSDMTPMFLEVETYTPLATGGTLLARGTPSGQDGGAGESGSDFAGSGGLGGLIASSGVDGTLGASTGASTLQRFYPFGLGGAAGKAIVGTAFIKYIVTGTITGAIE